MIITWIIVWLIAIIWVAFYFFTSSKTEQQAIEIEEITETNKETKTISLVMNSKKYGVILDNLKLTKNGETLNYTFNAINNINTEYERNIIIIKKVK